MLGHRVPEVQGAGHHPGQPDQGKPFRLSAQVGGRIPTGENLRTQLLTLHVGQTPRPLTGNPDSQSQWSGMSGAVVFAGQIVVGVVTEHHRPEGDNSLTVVPVTAIGDLTTPQTGGRLLGTRPDDFVRLPVREAPRRRDRVYVWTAHDSEAGMRVSDDIRQASPFERDERVSVATIRRGRLPHLQRDFRRLAEAFETWLIPIRSSGENRFACSGWRASRARIAAWACWLACPVRPVRGGTCTTRARTSRRGQRR